MHTYTKKPTLSDQDRQAPDIKLLISGFSAQTVVSIDDVVQTVDALPVHHLNGLLEIIFDPNRETEISQDILESSCNTTAKGIYVQTKGTVVLYDFENGERFRHILYHEIGHHVFYRILNSFDKKHWVTVLNPRSRHVTRYAMRNAAEDFADSYAVFMLNPKKLQKILSKYIFLRDRVFAGIANNISAKHLDVVV